MPNENHRSLNGNEKRRPMPKRLTHARVRFIQQARKRRALAADTSRGESTQSKGVWLSRDGTRSIMNRSERRWTAYHEAGHAVTDALLGLRFRQVTIVPSGHLLGRVERTHVPMWRRSPRRFFRIYARRIIINLLAGGLAERLARRDGQASGLKADLEIVVRLIALLPGTRSLNGRYRRHLEMHLQAEDLVRSNWHAIDVVARRLIRDKTLSERQVLRIVRAISARLRVEHFYPQSAGPCACQDGQTELHQRGDDPCQSTN
jgi:hypothetical protein